MIKNIKYTINKEIERKLQNNEKYLTLISKFKLKDNVIVNFGKVNLISSLEKNKTGKTMIVNTIDFVLNINKNQKITRLTNEIYSSKEFEDTHRVLFIYDVEIEFHNGIKIKRKIDFDEEPEKDNFTAGSYEVNGETKDDKEVKEIIQTKIYENWPINYHFSNMKNQFKSKSFKVQANPYARKTDKHITYFNLVNFFSKRQPSKGTPPTFFTLSEKMKNKNGMLKSLAFSYLGLKSKYDFQTVKEIYDNAKNQLKNLSELEKNIDILKKTNKDSKKKPGIQIDKYIRELEEIKENLDNSIKSLIISERKGDEVEVEHKKARFSYYFGKYKEKIKGIDFLTKTMIVKGVIDTEELLEHEEGQRNLLYEKMKRDFYEIEKEINSELNTDNVIKLSDIFSKETEQDGSDLLTWNVQNVVDAAEMLSKEVQFPFLIIDNIADQKNEDFNELFRKIKKIISYDKFDQYIFTNSHTAANEEMEKWASEDPTINHISLKQDFFFTKYE